LHPVRPQFFMFSAFFSFPLFSLFSLLSRFFSHSADVPTLFYAKGKADFWLFRMSKCFYFWHTLLWLWSSFFFPVAFISLVLQITAPPSSYSGSICPPIGGPSPFLVEVSPTTLFLMSFFFPSPSPQKSGLAWPFTPLFSVMPHRRVAPHIPPSLPLLTSPFSFFNF